MHTGGKAEEKKGIHRRIHSTDAEKVRKRKNNGGKKEPEQGKTDRRKGGIAIIIHKSLAGRLGEIWMEEHDIGWITLKNRQGKTDMRIIYFYGPTTDKGRARIRKAWETLEEQVEGGEQTLICMDGNARVKRSDFEGKEAEIEEDEDSDKVRFGRGMYEETEKEKEQEKTEYATKHLIELMEENDMYALCTLRKEKDREVQAKAEEPGNWTYQSNTANGKVKSKIDYIIGTRGLRERTRTIEYGGTKLGNIIQKETGHRPMIIKIGKETRKNKRRMSEEDPIKRKYCREAVKNMM